MPALALVTDFVKLAPQTSVHSQTGGRDGYSTTRSAVAVRGGDYSISYFA